MIAKPITWAYGVTTVPQRMESLLPRTLESLSCAGFDNPWLFIDGQCEIPDSLRSYNRTQRVIPLRAFGNWVLALYEIYVRSPQAHRYAIFQDDLIACKNLRSYLEHCHYEPSVYWNLYTVPQNEVLVERNLCGWHRSNQKGRGAVALVFDRDAVLTILGSQLVLAWPQNVTRGWRSVDGAVLYALRNAGYYELIHNPSLVQHTGHETSAIGNPQNQLICRSKTFRGEDYDAMQFVVSTCNSVT